MSHSRPQTGAPATPRRPRPARVGLTRLLVLALLLSLLGGLGCGRKLWPKPTLSEDVFSLTGLTGTRRASCLTVEAKVTGAADNLDGVTLLLAETGPDRNCPDCPFTPENRVEIDRSSPLFSLNGQDLRLQFCGLSPSPYRWRLVARNSFPALPPVVTPVLVLP